MRNYYLTLLVFFFAILVGCQKDEEKIDFKVSGILKSDGKPLENASINIDGLEQYKTTSNSEGYFVIENIPKGRHTLNTNKSSTDNSFINKSYDIELQNNDLNFDLLVLPNPVLIDTILLDSLSNIATIKWNKSKAEDFREYKLYSHSSSGLDESTGLLEHVTIDVNDTVKDIQLENLSTKYFRVFVLNEYDKLGGSNITSITSINKNLILGGGFNSLDDLNNWDTTEGNISISNNTHEGLGSALLTSKIDTIDRNINNWSISSNAVSTSIELEANRDYTISFWYKVSGLGNMMVSLIFSISQDNQEKFHLPMYFDNWPGVGIPNNRSLYKLLYSSDWAYFSKTFTSDSESYATFEILSFLENVWIDNLEVKIIE